MKTKHLPCNMQGQQGNPFSTRTDKQNVDVATNICETIHTNVPRFTHTLPTHKTTVLLSNALCPLIPHISNTRKSTPPVSLSCQNNYCRLLLKAVERQTITFRLASCEVMSTKRPADPSLPRRKL